MWKIKLKPPLLLWSLVILVAEAFAPGPWTRSKCQSSRSFAWSRRGQDNRGMARTTRLAAEEGRSSATLLSFLATVLDDDDDTGLLLVLDAVATACKSISHEVRRAGLTNNLGLYQGSQLGVSLNAGGESQKKLDVVSNDILKGILSECKVVRALASEEEDGVVEVNAGSSKAKYVVVYDPLDGSSNVEASIPTGTIFGVYRSDDQQGDVAGAVLQQGRRQVAAGYCLYSSAAIMVLAVKGKGTHMFTFDTRVGDFRLSRPYIQIPKRGSSYSLNEARVEDWPPGLQRYITDLKKGLSESGSPYSLMYVCSLVADVHWVLVRGGMASNPRSHLRLVYEGNPMAMVVEEAGGMGSTGIGPILDVQPSKVHERIPVFVGSTLDIKELESYGKLYGGVQQLENPGYAN